MRKAKRQSAKRPSEVDVAVGRNMRIWRMAKGVSQGELANRLGVTFQQVQKYEVGHNRMSMGRLVKAARILGVAMSALFEGVNDSDPVHALLTDSRAFRLAQAFAAIDNTPLRFTLVTLVEKIAASVPPEKRRRRR